MSLILITHNLRLAFSTCERSMCSTPARCSKSATRRVERQPFHPYTLGLLLSEPPADIRVPRLVAIRGSVPRAADVVDRCGFADRCDWAKQICRAGKPPLRPRCASRSTACVRRRDPGELDALRTAALSAAPIAPRRDEAEGALVRVDALVKTFVGREAVRSAR